MLAMSSQGANSNEQVAATSMALPQPSSSETNPTTLEGAPLNEGLATKEDKMDSETEPSRGTITVPGNEEVAMKDSEDDENEAEVGGNLMADFESAMGGDFDFSGTYAFGTTCPEAPNPCISIDGLGAVGIPLSPRDAKEIIKCSNQAPYGHGERTVVDKDVRDTWEIEPHRVSFGNPQWDVFMNTTLVPLFCKQLGVAPSQQPPKVELYKMLLYETGSHFLPHQEYCLFLNRLTPNLTISFSTVKTPGMFATIVVILPSPYTGGEVHTSHASDSKSFDFSASSFLTTSVLAWYTDVRHEVKPVTSGYRWALSYNFIHTSPGIPLPVLPNMSNSQLKLAYTLKKWAKRAYPHPPELIAYILDHEYSEFGLNDGFQALKGKDAHKVQNLREVADKEGFVVCLGNLNYHESGAADDDGYGYHKRSYRDYYDDYDEYGRDSTPGMMEVYDRDLTLNKLFDLDGVDMLDNNSLTLGMEQVIPEGAFEDADPDDTEYEGYMGNGAGSLDHYYHRTVAVIAPRDDIENICIGAAGIMYLLRKVTSTRVDPPTPQNLKYVEAIMRMKASWSPEAPKVMYDNALFWKDVKLWDDVLNAIQYDIAKLGPEASAKVAGAVKTFNFSSISSSLSSILSKVPSLVTRTQILEMISKDAHGDEPTAVQQWCTEMTAKSFQSITAPVAADVPILVAIMKERGLAFIHETVVPQLVKLPGIYDFWAAYLTELVRLKEEYISSSTAEASPDVKIEYERLLDQAFKSSFAACFITEAKPNNNIAYPTYAQYGRPQRLPSQYVDRVVALVTICINAGQPERCQLLLETLLRIKPPSTVENAFTSTYIPIIQQLKGKTEINLQLPVFTDFLKEAIFKYLREVVGTKPTSMIAPRKFGCGCSDCNQVTHFIASGSQSELTLRLYAAPRRHIASQAPGSKDLVSHVSVSGRLAGFRFTKTPSLASHFAWATRQKSALDFLKMIGEKEELQRIMGTRYEDGIKAIQGSRAFGVDPGSAPAVGSRTSAAARPVPQTSSNLGRKRPAPSNVVSVGVIDLTDD